MPEPMTTTDDLETILARFAGKGRSYLLPCLWAVQQATGWLSPERVARVGALLNVPLADIFGVIDFYTMLYAAPQGRHLLRVCDDVACCLAHPHGSNAVLEAIRAATGLQQHGETTPDGAFTLEVLPCLGRCEQAPVLMIDDHAVAHADPAAIMAYLQLETNGDGEDPRPHQVGGDRTLTTWIGRIDPLDLAAYTARGGFAALRLALGELTPGDAIQRLEDSGLVGRGGAAFPTGVKWRAAANETASPKMVVCNADESETGTFKDRILLEGDPYRLIEAMVLCAYTIRGHGQVEGYIYLRGEYAALHARLERVLARCRDAGYLGRQILGTTLDFDIELRLGAGAYVCGEETALFESIEGNRGMPRLKPPFPTQAGLFGKPTVINNVETFFNIPDIVQHGPLWLRQRGTALSPGTKLFCVSGRVQHPGLYELPLGRSLRHLIYQQAGGPLPGHHVTAVLLGGAAGTFVGPEHFDVALDWQSLREIGATLGSGAVIVLDETVDPWEVLRRVARFFAHESCGKCYPCQIGTQRQWEMVERLRRGDVRATDRLDLDDLAATMRDASICGLGQTATAAVVSAIDLWQLTAAT